MARVLRTKREAAEYLRCSISTVDRLIAAGQITRYKPSGVTLIDLAELDELVTASASGPRAYRRRSRRRAA